MRIVPDTFLALQRRSCLIAMSVVEVMWRNRHILRQGEIEQGGITGMRYKPYRSRDGL